MRKQVILCLKVAWTVAALMILLVGTSVCTSSDEACGAAGDSMLLFMVLLTFPAGIIMFPISMGVVASVGGHYPSDHIIGWSIMAIGGWLQWFWFVPRFLEKPVFTLLNLKSEPISPAGELAGVANSGTLSIIPSSDTRVAVSARVKTRARRRSNEIRSFDKFGHSPLERVIKR